MAYRGCPRGHPFRIAFLGCPRARQRHIAQNCHFDIFAILDRFPHLLGIGIDEGTAIEVSGGEFRV